MRRTTIEVCVEGVDGLIAAQDGGADRVELCASLLEGGITPSFGVVRQALAAATIPVMVIVRPRGGDFLYSEYEFQSMLDDVHQLRELGVAGVVVGCLTPAGRIDEQRMKALVEAAQPLAVTCHRAFDMTVDFRAALETLIRAGVDRVLTSGQHKTALAGLEILKATHDAAAGRIQIIACGGLNETNVVEVLRRSEADELHFRAAKIVDSVMRFRNPQIGMGGAAREREYQLSLTDSDAVRRTIAAVRAWE